MKKISNISDIQIKKMQLRIRQLELEKNIQNNWHDLKKNLNHDMLTEYRLSQPKEKLSAKDYLIVNGLDLAAGMLSRKLTNIFGQKIEAVFQRGVGKLAKKFKPEFKNMT
jgi:hypothetical protein